MTSLTRRTLGILIALATILAASCDGEGGIGVGTGVGPRAKWGGGTSGPGVIVMGGGPVY